MGAFEKDARVRVADEVVSRVLDGEAVILALKDGMYFGLDPVGTRIWELIGEGRDVRAILEALVGEYDVDAAQCERDLLSLLGDLNDKGLIDGGDAKGSQAP